LNILFTITMETKEIAGNYVAQWGEGPLWFNDSLYYVDIEKHKVIRYLPELELEECWDVGQRVGVVVPRSNGGLVIGGDTGYSFLDPESGDISKIFDPEHSKKLQRYMTE